MNKLLTGGIVSAALIGAVGVGAPYAAAQGNGAQDGTGIGDAKRYGAANGQGQGQGRTAVLEARASALGVSVEELQAAIDDGKTMQEVAAENGLSQEQYQTKMTEAAKARWAERGLSSDEIAERTAWREDRQANCDGTGSNQGEGGYGRQQHGN